MQTAFSDIYNCTACNDALSFPVDEDGEEAHHWPALVCLACSLAYRVDEATGDLLPVEDVIGKLRAEVERLTARVAELTEEHEADQEERAMRREDRDQHLADRARDEAEIERLTAERDAITQALDDDCAPDIDGDRIKTLADRIGALLGHWQDEIRGALCAVVPDPHRIDGGGCDSGDPLDLTLAEVAQAVNQLTDRAEEQIAAQIAVLTAERDAARRDAEERRLELLAERGDAEGAPSADWTPRDGYWEHTSGAEVLIAPDQSYGLWQLWLPHGITGRLELASDDVLTARAAMRRLNP